MKTPPNQQWADSVADWANAAAPAPAEPATDVDESTYGRRLTPLADRRSGPTWSPGFLSLFTALAIVLTLALLARCS